MTGGGVVEARVTVPDAETAQRLARYLVEHRLAACAQILGPMTSVYFWEDDVQQAEEWLLLVKTTGEGFAELSDAVLREHSYEVPEILAVPVSHALEAYAAWVREQVRPWPQDPLGTPSA